MLTTIRYLFANQTTQPQPPADEQESLFSCFKWKKDIAKSNTTNNASVATPLAIITTATSTTATTSKPRDEVATEASPLNYQTPHVDLVEHLTKQLIDETDRKFTLSTSIPQALGTIMSSSQPKSVSVNNTSSTGLITQQQSSPSTTMTAVV